MQTKKLFMYAVLLFCMGGVIVGAQTPVNAAAPSVRLPPPPKEGAYETATEAPGGTGPGGGPIGWPILVGDREVDAILPAVAYNEIDINQDYLVVWQNDRPGFDDIYAQLVGWNNRLKGGWRAVSAGQGAERRAPDIDHNLNFNEYLVVWEHLDYGTGKYTIRGQRLHPNADKSGGDFAISQTGLKSAFTPAVAHAFSAGIYLVVWENHTQGAISNDIIGQLVANDGTLLGNNFIIGQGTTGFSYEAPDVAYNRRMNEFLVVWQRLDKNAGIYDIYARVVRPDGSMKPQLELTRYTKSCTSPAVAAQPTATPKGEWLVVWELERSAVDHDIMGRFVYGDGNPDPANFYIAAHNEVEHSPAVAGSEGANRFLVTWVYQNAPPLVTALVKGRSVLPTGEFAASEKQISAFTAEHPAATSGPTGDFLIVYEDLFQTGNRDIFGQFWGNRTNLPLLEK